MTGREYLVAHGVDLEVAEDCGVEVGERAVSYPYVRPDGSRYRRVRHLAGRKTIQPPEEPLALWWPVGRPKGERVLVCEGESDALAVLSALRSSADGDGAASYARGRLDGVCAVPGVTFPSERLADALRDAGVREAVVAFDGDDPGRRGAEKAVEALKAAGIVAVVAVVPDGEDVASLLAAAADPIGCLADVLPEELQDATAEPDSALVDEGPPLDAADLLDMVAETIRRFVVVSDEQRDVLALWALHAHAIEAADTTAYLNVSSPEKQSGKSRLLETLAQLVPRAMEAANVSDAALFRALSSDDGPATLLYDEVDALFGKQASTTKEEQRGLLNAGYRRGAVAWRCEGDGSRQTVTPYPVFGAKALAGIGELPETLADRSIPIRLRRRRPDEQVERGRYKTIQAACEPLREASALWAEENIDRLRHADPELPDELSDRAQDGAEPLLAIADLAGGEWPRRARSALIELHADKSEENESWGVRLLADIRSAIDGEDRIATTELIARLKADDEAPWGSWGKADAGLTPRGLAKLLAPYQIRSRTIRFDGGTVAKGFKAAQFEDAWERYLAPPLTSQGLQGYNGSTERKADDLDPLQGADVTDRKSASNPHSRAVVTEVTDRARNGDDAGVGGCPSHRGAPLTGCRYCRLAAEEAMA